MCTSAEAKQKAFGVSVAAGLFVIVSALAAQSVYPTGTTIYDPERAWNGYTVLSPLATQEVLVVDMNGASVKRWEGYNNSAGGPARVLPGGFVVGASGARPPHHESLELIQRDFDGNVVWRFSRSEEVKTASTIWSARQHHDWQRENLPAGYYSPDSTPGGGGTTLLLTHTNRTQPKVADRPLEDDRLIEVSWTGEIVWEWVASDHIDEGLPGAGNLLVFDNGGASGYGFANPVAPDGRGAFARATSRVLEINPVTLELVWSYSNPRFYSSNISGAQRLPNGNTLITAGTGGRIFEIAPDGTIVWEYLYPLFSGAVASNAVYRAYRLPYGWIPQLKVPTERRVTPPTLGEFRVP